MPSNCSEKEKLVKGGRRTIIDRFFDQRLHAMARGRKS
jgi:hypothetical protein